MVIKEKLKKENSNNNTICLYKEGMFYRVYEHSAYLFVINLKEYQLTKKYYKNVKQELVYLGFPQDSFSKIEVICKEQNLSIKKEDKQIIINGFANFTEKEFLRWKKEISFRESKQLTGNILSDISAKNDVENDIIKKIRNFSVVNKTPIECQQFIVELQNELTL